MLRARITLLTLVLVPVGAYVGMIIWRTWQLQPLPPERAVAAMQLPFGFSVDIAEGEDDILVLASTVVIDMSCHADRKDGH